MTREQIQHEGDRPLPCAAQEAFRCRPDALSDDEKTILSAIALQKGEAEAAEIFRESPEHLRDYTTLKGVNSYAALGRYYLANETTVPEELYEYMDLGALGCRYEDEHPGVFIGNDYVQYPTAEQKPSMEMQIKELRATILAESKEHAEADRRIRDAAGMLENAVPHITEWDETAIRQLVAQVKVLSKNEISVMLKSGIEIRQSITN